MAAKFKLGQEVFLLKKVDIQKAIVTEIRVNSDGVRYLITDPIETTEPSEQNVKADKKELSDYFQELFAKLVDTPKA